MQILGSGIVAAVLALHLLVLPSSANVVHKGHQPADEDPTAEADRIAAGLDAENAKTAAETAKQAAIVANNVAEHSVKITGHAKKALKNALGALHEARVDTQGLDSSQKDSLKKAEAKLREATKTAEFGKLKKVEDKNAQDLKMDKMQSDLDKIKKAKKTSELEQMRSEVKELRKRLKENDGDSESDKELQELESELERLEKAPKAGKADEAEAQNDEMKAEIERLRDQIDKLEEQESKSSVDYDVSKAKGAPSHELPKDGKAGGSSVKVEYEEENKELMTDVKMQPLSKGGDRTLAMPHESEATPVEEKGIDIDTAMPYGDLEPFGREDTAQELTESSVKESDAMVDQLERAEVAEEKRSVFRALTRLRGAAITSFDGVARSQTGNIDEYNKIHKWRKTHPLHHLADEESDVSKWAFPDNAD